MENTISWYVYNLIKFSLGAFYQPDAVIIDLDTLDTLQSREFVSGIAEVIKDSLIRDSEFFEWQEENIQRFYFIYDHNKYFLAIVICNEGFFGESLHRWCT